jgi:peptidoglycan/xylan/chitin deacetylase (PgdA/CDA1 family)
MASACAPAIKEEGRGERYAAARAGEGLPGLAEHYYSDPDDSWRIASFNRLDPSAPINPDALLAVPLGRARPMLTESEYPSVPVLSYGPFSDAVGDAVSPDEFRAQMLLLKEQGYHTLTLDEFQGFLRNQRAIPPRSVLITMDTGFHSQYEHAFPVLKEHGMSAVLFLRTGEVGRGGTSLTWDQVREMSGAGIEVESAGLSGKALSGRTRMSAEDYLEFIKEEIEGAQSAIRDEAGHLPRYFAYPSGKEDMFVAEALKASSYKGAFIGRSEGPVPVFTHDYAIGRKAIEPGCDTECFEQALGEPGHAPEARIPASTMEELLEGLKEDARGLEREGRLKEAHARYEAVADLDPFDKEASLQSAELERKMEGLKDRHYHSGTKALGKGREEQAREELLKSLAYGKADALERLKQGPKEKQYSSYRTGKGDTPESVARKHYGSRKYEPVVSYLHPAGDDGTYRQGSVLMFPKSKAIKPVKKVKRKRKPPPPRRIKKIKKKPEPIAIPAPEPKPEPKPEPMPVVQAPPADTAGMGYKELLKAGRYAEAREDAERAASRGDRKAKRALRNMKRTAAREHKNGKAAFKKGDLAGALRRWEKAHALDPSVRGLDEDIMHTGELLRATEAFNAGRYAEAAREAERASGYTLTMKGALELIRKLKALAEEHYQRGLQLYVTEHIDEAIAEWERALEFYPGHETTKTEHDGARELLERMLEVAR